MLGFFLNLSFVYLNFLFSSAAILSWPRFEQGIGVADLHLSVPFNMKDSMIQGWGLLL